MTPTDKLPSAGGLRDEAGTLDSSTTSSDAMVKSEDADEDKARPLQAQHQADKKLLNSSQKRRRQLLNQHYRQDEGDQERGTSKKLRMMASRREEDEKGNDGGLLRPVSSRRDGSSSPLAAGLQLPGSAASLQSVGSSNTSGSPFISATGGGTRDASTLMIPNLSAYADVASSQFRQQIASSMGATSADSSLLLAAAAAARSAEFGTGLFLGGGGGSSSSSTILPRILAGSTSTPGAPPPPPPPGGLYYPGLLNSRTAANHATFGFPLVPPPPYHFLPAVAAVSSGAAASPLLHDPPPPLSSSASSIMLDEEEGGRAPPRGLVVGGAYYPPNLVFPAVQEPPPPAAAQRLLAMLEARRLASRGSTPTTTTTEQESILVDDARRANDPMAPRWTPTTAGAVVDRALFDAAAEAAAATLLRRTTTRGGPAERRHQDDILLRHYGAATAVAGVSTAASGGAAGGEEGRGEGIMNSFRLPATTGTATTADEQEEQIEEIQSSFLRLTPEGMINRATRRAAAAKRNSAPFEEQQQRGQQQQHGRQQAPEGSSTKKKNKRRRPESRSRSIATPPLLVVGRSPPPPRPPGGRGEQEEDELSHQEEGGYDNIAASISHGLAPRSLRPQFSSDRRSLSDYHQATPPSSSTSSALVKSPAGLSPAPVRGPAQAEQEEEEEKEGEEYPATTSDGDDDHGRDNTTRTKISNKKRPSTHFTPYTYRPYIPLATDEDQNWLSDLLCFVRSEIVEVFQATNEEVSDRSNMSKKIVLGQVGIRCRFCSHLESGLRASRSACYPSSISRIYQSLTMMLRDHFSQCLAIPKDVMKRFIELRGGKTSQGATNSKDYWIKSALSKGLTDTKDGRILMKDPTTSGDAVVDATSTCSSSSSAAAISAASATASHQLILQPPKTMQTSTEEEEKEESFVPLALPSDRESVSEFYYTLAMQSQKVYLTVAERSGNRSSLQVGMPGIGCKHCCAKKRKGMCRFFPARRRTVSRKFDDFYAHIQRCTLCPNEVKVQLAALREKELTLLPNRRQEKFFYDLIWERLHDDCIPVKEF